MFCNILANNNTPSLFNTQTIRFYNTDISTRFAVKEF